MFGTDSRTIDYKENISIRILYIILKKAQNSGNLFTSSTRKFGSGIRSPFALGMKTKRKKLLNQKLTNQLATMEFLENVVQPYAFRNLPWRIQ